MASAVARQTKEGGVMPYIRQEDRQRFDRIIDSIPAPESAGELNYVFTRIIHDYVGNRWNYAGMNDVLGALEGAKLEFYRRVVAPYEDQKIQQNGDVGVGKVSNR